MKTKKIARFIVRITIIYIAFVFINTFINSIFLDKEYVNEFYIPLLELCLCIFVWSQGRCHCKYIRWTALSIFISDTITRLDNAYDFIPLGYWCLLPAFILAIGILTTLTLSLKHFIHLWNLQKKNK